MVKDSSRFDEDIDLIRRIDTQREDLKRQLRLTEKLEDTLIGKERARNLRKLIENEQWLKAAKAKRHD